ncbi:MAG TPA: TonB-dependent receptor [Gammaproteobacteria bacterium]
MRRTPLSAAVVTAMAGLGAASPAAWAQQGSALEEIIVTATRREVSLQDTPLAITAISSDDLEMRNIENAQDLTANVPNVLFYGTGRGVTNSTLTMRGIPNVGVYVDGVWQVSDAGLLQRQFIELDRVEVLRGPQGTLIGRDSAGGSVMIYTQPPQDEFGATIKLNAGSFDRRDVSASIDVPITETLLSRWTLASYKKDGYVESVTTGIDHGLLENEALRGDLLWTPTDSLSFRLIRQEDEQINTTAGVQTFINFDVAYRFGWQIGIAEAHHIASLAAGGRGFDCKSQVAGCPGGDLDEFQSTTALTSPDEIDVDSTTFIVDYDIGDRTSLRYTFGDTELLDEQWTDFAGAEFNFFTNYNVGFREFDSHELQLNFDSDRVHVVAGAFTWDQTERERETEWSHSDWSFPEGWGGGAGGSDPDSGPYAGPNPPPPGAFRTIDAGIPQTLSYEDVLESETCQRTPADYGFDFSSSDPALNPSILSGNGQFPTIDPSLDPNSVDGWPRPCDAFNAWVPLFATVVGFNGTGPAHDRGEFDHQEGFAIFTDVTFDITDRWDVTFGFRYHDQENTFYGLDLAGGEAAGFVEERPTQWDHGFIDPKGAVTSPLVDPATLVPAEFDETTYRLATSYDVTDNAMVYLNYSEGFTAGGADLSGDSLGTFITPFDPEIIENTEIGLRADFIDGRLRLNATYFMMDWIGVQAAQSVIDRATGDPITEVFTANAADAEADGLELELGFLATDRLSFGADLGWLDTAYVNVNPTAQFTENTEFGGAPEQTYHIWGDYVLPLGGDGANLELRLEGNYQGEFWRSEIPNFRPDIYGGPANAPAGDIWRWNARAVYTPADGAWELAGFVNNITDEVYLNSGFMDSIWQFDFSGVDAPREYGVSLSLRF